MGDGNEMSEEEYKGIVLSLEELLPHIYDLDRTELRRLALECLLVSDGPDRIEGDVDTNGISVTMKELGPDPMRPNLPDNIVMFVIDGI